MNTCRLTSSIVCMFAYVFACVCRAAIGVAKLVWRQHNVRHVCKEKAAHLPLLAPDINQLDRDAIYVTVGYGALSWLQRGDPCVCEDV
jgi:hypothetical protein